MQEKLVLLIVLLFLCASTSFAQITDEQNILEKLQFDVSSPEDAVNLLGKPRTDTTDELDSEVFDSWLKIKKNQKVFRKLIFKKVGKTENLILRFYENKLVKIAFDYGKKGKKEVPASDLSRTFNIDFVIVEGVLKGSKISDYEGQKENTAPKVYAPIYGMLSVKSNTIVFAGVDNTSWKSILLGGFVSKPTTKMFPGVVVQLHVISRSLMNEQSEIDKQKTAQNLLNN